MSLDKWRTYADTLAIPFWIFLIIFLVTVRPIEGKYTWYIALAFAITGLIVDTLSVLLP